MSKTAFRALILLATAAAMALGLAVIAQARAGDDGEDERGSIRGGGTTILQGGTGPPSFTPVLTKVAFHGARAPGISSASHLRRARGQARPEAAASTRT